jgi:hypothetical protein
MRLPPPVPWGLVNVGYVFEGRCMGATGQGSYRFLVKVRGGAAALGGGNQPPGWTESDRAQRKSCSNDVPLAAFGFYIYLCFLLRSLLLVY